MSNGLVNVRPGLRFLLRVRSDPQGLFVLVAPKPAAIRGLVERVEAARLLVPPARFDEDGKGVEMEVSVPDDMAIGIPTEIGSISIGARDPYVTLGMPKVVALVVLPILGNLVQNRWTDASGREVVAVSVADRPVSIDYQGISIRLEQTTRRSR